MTGSSTIPNPNPTTHTHPSRPATGWTNAALRAAHRIAGEVEPWTGWLASFSLPGYTDDPRLVGRGNGVYSAEDWSTVRREDLPWDSDETYLGYIFGREGINVIGAITLAGVFDFSRFRSIFEIGCGDMAQAYVIHRLHPAIRYVATDLDGSVIERCAKLSVLDGIEKRVLDVLAVAEGRAPFAGFDLLMSWGMEYALDDRQLLQLYAMARVHEVPYLLCSATTAGIGKYFRHLLQTRRRARGVRERRLRLTGWERSPLRFQRLARRVGLRVTVLGRFGYHFCMLLEPRDGRSAVA
ncbi:MAG: hypothetical protein ACJ8NR_12335, partial [Sulfurifustis sp.]